MVKKETCTGICLAAAMSLVSLVLLIKPLPCQACFSIVAGKNASADGYLIVAHNEDDPPGQIVNHHKIPRTRHAPDEKVRLLNGGELNQAEYTWAYLWSEMPGMLFSDGYVNEWGVSITSDKCSSREDKPEITDGGIGYMLRRLVAQRARTARQGVLLAGELVERFGYIDSGRTYIICDPDEAWFFCVVKGKHWLAQRVPDNEVAMVANTFTIRRVDLADKDNFLGSDDIITYAVSRGWYDPKKDGPFDFAAVYANPEVAASPYNLGRLWNGLKYVAAKPIPLGTQLAFSVVSERKLGVADLMRILRHSNEPVTSHSSSPAKTLSPSDCPLCSQATQASFVLQLRRNMPLDIGIVYWMCLASPHASFYVPFHFGITDFPAGFRSESQRPSDKFYEERVRSAFKADPLEAFWTFSNFCNKIYSASADTVARVRAQTEQVEKEAMSLQKPLEEAACRLYREDKDKAMQLLANYSDGIYMSSLEAMSRILAEK
jgi:dipeptidase